LWGHNCIVGKRLSEYRAEGYTPRTLTETPDTEGVAGGRAVSVF
jgi:hypothetical protein